MKCNEMHKYDDCLWEDDINKNRQIHDLNFMALSYEFYLNLLDYCVQNYVVD